MHTRRLALIIALCPLIVGCSAVEDYVGPDPTPAPTCNTGRVSEADRETNGLPDCPRSSVPAAPTDAEIEQQWEDAERDREAQLEQLRQEAQRTEGTCIDVTSYDYDWDNDVLCTRHDGIQFYTSYEGADAFLAGY